MRSISTILLLIITIQVMAQEETKFDEMLKGMYEYTVPLVKNQQLDEWMSSEKVYLLDTREQHEFEVSHIKGARNVGYDNFKLSSVNDIPKDAKIVVYCSVGYRSERIGEKLIREGYNHVFNLYGSIFDWANDGYDLYDSNGKVKKVHAYNEDWSKWIENGAYKKVY